MNTRYKRNTAARLAQFWDDLAWTWERHREGFLHGFAFGAFVVLMAFYFVMGAS